MAVSGLTSVDITPKRRTVTSRQTKGRILSIGAPININKGPKGMKRECINIREEGKEKFH